MLDHDSISRIKNLFGSIKNAHRILGLQLDVPYMTFYRAMQFLDITPVQRDMIVRRWEKWRSIYLVHECPMNADMQLNPMDPELEPEWKNGKSPSSTPSKRKRPG